jgi:raffinose/stachyose/melibiose transport system permease protein
VAGVTLKEFSSAWKIGGLGQGLVNSLLIVTSAALLTTLVASLAGFALAKLRVPFRKLLLGVLMLAIAVPVPAIVIPLFVDGLSHGYSDSRAGLAVVYAAVTTGWGTWYLYSYFQSLPNSLLESARIDGASDLRIFAWIAVPLARSAIATLFVFNFFFLWSDLLLAVVLLLNPSYHTVTVGVALLDGGLNVDIPLKAAGVLIAVAPNLVLFVIAQRFLTAGVLSGASKE